MSFKDSKVVIVGCGNVGVTTAHSILIQGLCEDICLIDVNKERAIGEALDLQDSVFFMNRNVRVHAGDYSECADADIVIISAAAPMPKDASNRLEMLQPSLHVFDQVVDSVMEQGFDGIFLVVSNPVDVMSYYTWRRSSLPKEHVIGSGTLLDTARLSRALSELYDFAPNSAEAYVLGEHGDSEIVSWNSATIGGKRVGDVLRDNAGRSGGITEEELRQKTIKAGWEIFSRKGNTCFGIASSTAAIAKTILFNENRILPVSVYVDGYYGINDTFISVPTIVDHTGAKEIVEIDLTAQELEALQSSAHMLHDLYAQL